MKNLKNYLHFYLQSEIKVVITKCSYTMVHEHNYSIGDTRPISTTTYKWFELDNCKLQPILRPLTSMTEAEMIECIKITANGGEEMFQQIQWDNKWLSFQQKFPRMKYWMNSIVDFERLDMDRFVWALRKGFDLFGLIDCGLALNHSIIEGGKEKIKDENENVA